MAISSWPHYVPRPKDPNATLDYQLDWSLWLRTNEILTDSDWTITGGGLVNSGLFTDTTATAWISGGTSGEVIILTNHITTNSVPVARVDERSLIIRIEER